MSSAKGEAEAEAEVAGAIQGTSQGDNAPQNDEPEPHVTGLCFFIDNNNEEWTDCIFNFVGNHELVMETFSTEGRVVRKTVDYAKYNMNRGLIGAYSHFVNRTLDWRPRNKTPADQEGNKCDYATLTGFSNRTVGGPALWLQFLKVKDFIKFYEYWLENICQRDTSDAQSETSIYEYEKLKKRHEEKEKEEAAKRRRARVVEE